MAKQEFTKVVKDSDTGVSYEFTLGDVYFNFGGRVQMTQVKNAGKPTEKRLPPVNLQIQRNTNSAPQAEDFEAVLAANPVIKQFIDEILKEASKPYTD